MLTNWGTQCIDQSLSGAERYKQQWLIGKHVFTLLAITRGPTELAAAYVKTGETTGSGDLEGHRDGMLLAGRIRRTTRFGWQYSLRRDSYPCRLGRYWRASARWWVLMVSLPSRSAMVRDSLRMRGKAWALKCSCVIAALTSALSASSSLQYSRSSVGHFILDKRVI